MPRDSILLNGKPYPIAKGRGGERLARTNTRPSQQGDPGALQVAEWRVDGPDFNSFELIGPGQPVGYLGRDYGVNTDGRWLGIDQLGPAINTVDLSVHDITYAASIPGTATFKPGVNLHLGPVSATENASGAAQIVGPDGTYLYVIRGTTPAKIDLSDMTVHRTGAQFPAPATSIVATRSDAAVREVAVGLGVAPYQVLTAVQSSPNTDTWVVNTANQAASIIAVAPDRVVGLDQHSIGGNILTGGVTMAAPNWNEIATIEGEELTPTGFAVDGSQWIIGTSNGPYMLDAQTAKFFPIIPEIEEDAANCAQMLPWYPIGVIVPLAHGLRWLKSGGGSSLGPELWRGFTGPLEGHPKAVAASERWLYTIDETHGGDAYLIAWRPREPGAPHPFPLSPYVIAKFTSTVSHFLRNVGDVNGVRTNPTLVGGSDSDMFWLTVGHAMREIADSAYRNATSGTTYLTELRRQPELLKDIEAIEFSSAQCGASDTITVGVSVDGAAAVTLSGTLTYAGGATLNGVVDTNGYQRLLPINDSSVPLTTLSGRAFKPQLAYAASAATASPQVQGSFRIYYRLRPLMVKVYRYTLELETGDVDTAKSREAALRALERSSGAVELQDHDFDTVYVGVTVGDAYEAQDRGGGESSARGTRRVVDVVLTSYQTAE